jgi:WD40 repeat protein
VRLLVGHTKDVRAVVYLPDGRVVSGGADRTVRVWNPATGEPVRTIKAGTPVYAVAAAPDGRTLASAGRHPGAEAIAVPIQTFGLAEGLPGDTFRCP